MSRPQRAVLEPPATALFDPGRNCWAVTEARDVRLLIDGSAYFEAFMRAALLARHTLFVLGWDFHSQTKLLCGDEKLPEAPDAPGEIGAFLDFLARRRRGLHIRVLIWDFPTIFGVEREFPFFSSFYWKPHRRLEISTTTRTARSAATIRRWWWSTTSSPSAAASISPAVAGTRASTVGADPRRISEPLPMRRSTT